MDWYKTWLKWKGFGQYPAVLSIGRLKKIVMQKMTIKKKFLFHPLSWLTLGRILERGKKGDSDDNDEEGSDSDKIEQRLIEDDYQLINFENSISTIFVYVFWLN
uniref:Uncharacterized protein n=1 Tax=Romanomermis culicivorax TaxID=13658 RepID=A0A915I1I7_ROMCU